MKMVQFRYSFVAIFGLVISLQETVDSFTLSTSRPTTTIGRTRTVHSSTQLLAGFATDAYLTSLNEVLSEEAVRAPPVTTADYLNSLHSFQVAVADYATEEPSFTEQLMSSSSSQTWVDETVASSTLVSDASSLEAVASPSTDANSMASSADFFSVDSSSAAATASALDVNAVGDTVSAAAANPLVDGSAGGIDLTAAADPLLDGSGYVDLSGALEGANYDALVQGTQAAASETTKSVVKVFDLSKISESLQGAGQALQGASETFQGASQSLLKPLQSAGGHLFGKGSAAVEGVGGVFSSEQSQLADLGRQTLHTTGDTKLGELASGTVQGLQAFARIMLEVLNALVSATLGTPLTELVASAESQVYGVVNGAIEAVVRTVQEIGNKSVAEAAESFVALVATVVKVLFLIFSTVLKAVSGKTASQWTVDITRFVEHEAGTLTQQASVVASDLSEKSLSELVSLMGSFLESSASLVVDGVHQLAYHSGSAPLTEALASSSPSIESATTTLSTLAGSL